MSSAGIVTARDSWCYNYSEKDIASNIRKTIDFYNMQVDTKQHKGKSFEVLIDTTQITWSDSTRNMLEKGTKIQYNPSDICDSQYRPFTKQKLYFNKQLNHRTYQMKKIYPKSDVKNLIICVELLHGVR